MTQILKTSNLHKKYKYKTQINIENNTHSQIQPNIIIQLPQKKNIIIDTKITLITYKHYFNTENNYTHKNTLQKHIASIHNHIHLLKHKNYQQLPKLQTLNYILIFIPIKPTFLLTLNHQPKLITETLKNNIILINPTTLLITLHTIANL